MKYRRGGGGEKQGEDLDERQKKKWGNQMNKNGANPISWESRNSYD